MSNLASSSIRPGCNSANPTSVVRPATQFLSRRRAKSDISVLRDAGRKLRHDRLRLATEAGNLGTWDPDIEHDQVTSTL